MPFATPSGRAVAAQLLDRANEGEDEGALSSPVIGGAADVAASDASIEQTVAASVVEARPASPSRRKMRWVVLAAALVVAGIGSVTALRWRALHVETDGAMGASTPTAPPSAVEPAAAVTFVATTVEPASSTVAPSASATVGVSGEPKKRRRPVAAPVPATSSTSARGKTTTSTGFGGTALDGHD
jgi:hypothetical protein